MGDMAVYQKTTTLDDGYFQDDDDISNIQLIPPSSKRTAAACSSCVQRWCTALLVVCLALLVTGLIVLGVMVRQLQTDLNALKGVDTQQSIGKSDRVHSQCTQIPLYAMNLPRGLASKVKAQRLFPSDKFFWCFCSSLRQVNALRGDCGGDGVKRGRFVGSGGSVLGVL